MTEHEHKQFIYSTLEHLHKLHESSDPIVMDKQKLKEGIASLEEAFGLYLQDNEHRIGYSLHNTNPNLSLPKIVSLNVEHQVESKPMEITDPVLLQKFEQYVSKLHQTPYFKDVEKGSKQYFQRLQKAKEKFIKKYEFSKKTEIPVEKIESSEEIEQRKNEAERFKNLGNQLLKEQKFLEAIKSYTSAIELLPTAIYYSNRAAAYQYLEEFQNVIEDCQQAIKLDPKYNKSYLRIAAAYESLKDFDKAAEYYQALLNVEPGNQQALQGLESLASKRKPPTGGNTDFSSFLNDPSLRDLANNIQRQREENPQNMPQTDTPPFQEILNNPNIMGMAQEAMKNGNFGQMMNNPAFMQMAQQLMSDPNSLGQLMQSFGLGGNNNK